ncbi:transcriptional regulator [Streptomyces albiflavescens]|uniref:Transcriptional regulator n=1 Tax=Streptomyces albiflavescens TaxID=1623582 RepID=A0A917XWL1_9ACTN|nr:YafY family protein [Streptomyces albiflavescens]GGN56960.1 transcriptional regulator [Streptomyces albiflavescens]
MNRTDRLYALVEELRAAAPRPRSARTLARRFEVSIRTIERDLAALQQSGVPIHAEPGRTGGYVLDRERTLPPLSITPAEATALAVGLRALTGTPFAADARSALHKVLAVMPGHERAAAADLAGRVRLLVPASAERRPSVPTVPGPVCEALTAGRTLRLEYADVAGAVTGRTVEPLGFLGGHDHWYLLAWCRLRSGARCFRLDRIREAVMLDERAPRRSVDPAELDMLGWDLVPLGELGM